MEKTIFFVKQSLDYQSLDYIETSYIETSLCLGKLMSFVFLLCSTPSFAQMFVGESVQIHLSCREDTLSSQENKMYIHTDISGEGVVSLSKVDCIITKNIPKLAHILLRNSQTKLKGKLLLSHSIVLENSYLEAEEAQLVLAPDIKVVLDDQSTINHKTAFAEESERIATSNSLLTLQNHSLLLRSVQSEEVTFYITYTTIGNINFAKLKDKTIKQYIKQEIPPPKNGLV